MNSGGKIEQNSVKYNRDISKNMSLDVEYHKFEVFNNPIEQVIREQWNSDLLENFTLKNYENPNLNKVVEGHDDFVAAKFDMVEVTLERELSGGFSMLMGFGNIDTYELDHPYYLENKALGRVTLIPESYYYVGATVPYLNGIVSGKVSKQENLISSSRPNDYNISKYTLNYTKKLLKNNSILALNLEGGIEGSSDHEVGLTYRIMY